MKKGLFSLLASRRFGPFFFTQFLGAFNDNVFRQALILLIASGVAVIALGVGTYLYWTSDSGGGGGGVLGIF